MIQAASTDRAEESSTVLAHLKLAHELRKDAEEGLRVGGLAVLSEERGHLRELLHGSGLQGLQRLDCRVAVLQKALWCKRSQIKEAHRPCLVSLHEEEFYSAGINKCLLWL